MVIPETSALRRLRQEGYCKLEASMGYSVSPCHYKERRKEEEKEISIKSR